LTHRFLDDATASTREPLSFKAAQSTAGKPAANLRERRLLLASAIEMRKRTEANPGAHRT